MDGDVHNQFHSRQGDKIPLRQYIYEQEHERKGSTANVDYFEPSKLRIAIKPMLMVAMTTGLSISILFVYLAAEGQTLDYTILGLKMPSLISLLLSINAIVITGGLSMSMAEYKWVHLNKGTPLTLIDLYDACSRGLGGFVNCIQHLQIDSVLIIMLILHLGILVISPVSLELLVPYSPTTTLSNNETKLYVNNPTVLFESSDQDKSLIPSDINGFTRNGYIIPLSFSLASMHSQPPIIPHTCLDHADHCIYKNVAYISTSFVCSNASESESIVDLHSNNITTISSYLQRTKTSSGYPSFFYPREMHNRTYYNLNNQSLAAVEPKHINPEHLVGTQSFLMAYSSKGIHVNSVENMNEVLFKKCQLNSTLNNSTWKTENGSFVSTSYQSTPIDIDYDKMAGNNSEVTGQLAVMVNAYKMQQSLINELVISRYSNITTHISQYTVRQTENIKPSFDNYLADVLHYFDYHTLMMPMSSSTYSVEGEAFMILAPVYRIHKIGCYVMSLSLLIPSIAWIGLWVISMRAVKNIARGSSNISLLATTLTPLAEYNLRNFAKLDSETIFKRAKHIRMRTYVYKDNAEERIYIGMEGESFESLQP